MVMTPSSLYPRIKSAQNNRTKANKYIVAMARRQSGYANVEQHSNYYEQVRQNLPGGDIQSLPLGLTDALNRKQMR
jgi:hypothetical protein